MNNRAIGLVETYGYIGAVEALDVALKAANVKFLGCKFVKGGIVTIMVIGDVAAVKAAVDAAEVAVPRVGTLRTTHVIARASEDVFSMLNDTTDEKVILNENVEIVEKDEKANSLDKKESIEKEPDKEKNEDNNEENTNLPKDDKNTSDDKKLSQHIEDILNKEVQEKNVKNNNPINYTQEQLENMKVDELRTLARKVKVTSLTKKQIRFGKKKQLIEAILDKLRGGEQ
jgi:microcompartment protein CcmL/EutN